jgi:hypothetical protein
VFEMAAQIQSPAKCDVSSVIRFINAKCERPGEIHKQIHKEIIDFCGNVMNRHNVTQCCCEFSEGRTDVQGEQKNGRPSLMSYDLLQEFEEEIRSESKRDDKRVASHHSRSV